MTASVLTPEERERAIKLTIGCREERVRRQVKEALAKGHDSAKACRRAVGTGGGRSEGFSWWHDSRSVMVTTADGRTGSISYREIARYVTQAGLGGKV